MRVAGRLKDSMETISRIVRYSGFLTISLLFRWPIWIALGAARIFRPFDWLFLVYPGTDADLDGYCPRRLAKSRLFRGKPTVGGIVSKGSSGRGLLLVAPDTAQEMVADPLVCLAVMRRLEWIMRLCGAKAIAIAGQGPGIISRHGIEIKSPFVRGNRGTVFCVMQTIAEVMEKHGLKAGEFRLCLVGVGYVGELLLEALREEGHDAVGIDIRRVHDGVLLLEEGIDVLRRTDMAVVLTPKGSDFMPYISDLKEGAIVIDDTHPRIHYNGNHVSFYKVAVGMAGMRFYPRLPGYRADWIPGCAVEAICHAAEGNNGSGVSHTHTHKKCSTIVRGH